MYTLNGIHPNKYKTSNFRIPAKNINSTPEHDVGMSFEATCMKVVS